MATVNTCSACLVGGFSITSDLRELKINAASEMLDGTVFGNTTKVNVGGIKTGMIEGAGFVNLGSSQSDGVLFAKVGGDSDIVSAFPNGITAGSTWDRGYAMKAVEATYNPGAPHGQLLAFNVAAHAQSNLVRPMVLHNALVTALSTTVTNGTAYQFGPSTGSTESLYAGLHVTALSTTLAATITAVVQNGSSSGFATATNRISFSAQSCKAGTFATPVAQGSLSTDMPFWRTQITVSTGTSTGATANALVWMSVE